MNTIETRVARCFSNTFPDLGEDEIPRASTTSLAAWNSLAHVVLLSSIEEEFGLKFELEDCETLISYLLIVDCVESKAGKQ